MALPDERSTEGAAMPITPIPTEEAGGCARVVPTDRVCSARWLLLRVADDGEAREIEDYVHDLRSGIPVRRRRMPRDTTRPRVGVHPLIRVHAWSRVWGRPGATYRWGA